MDRDEPLPNSSERAHRGRLVVDEGTSLPVRRQLAAEQDRFVPGQARPHKLRTDASVRVELAGHRQARRALAHELGRTAAARQQRERVHEDGLARPGLARDDRQPGREVDLEVLDDREIPDRQAT